MSDLLAWILDFRARATKDGDQARMRLSHQHNTAFGFHETDPERALALFVEGGQLARALGESWWALYYDHWRLTALMHFRRDFRDVLDLAVQSVLEIRKSCYDGLPLRGCFHHHLIDAYLGIDPTGYAEGAREALSHLEAEPPDRDEDRYTLFSSQRKLALALGDLDEAERRCRQSLALGDADPVRHHKDHYGAFAYDGLCKIAWRRGDWPALGEHASAGEECARRVGHRLELADCLLWRALAAQRTGEGEASRRLYRQSVAGMSRLRMPPEPIYFDAICDFLEAEGEVEGQWAVRERELATLTDMGRFDAEGQCRLKRCRLLARLRRPLDEELAAARETAAKLKNPAPRLAELDAIARDGTEPRP